MVLGMNSVFDVQRAIVMAPSVRTAPPHATLIFCSVAQAECSICAKRFILL